MTRRFYIFTLLFATIWWGPANVSALMQNQSLDEMRREYDSSFSKRSKLAARLDALEANYRELVSQIDATKKSGGMKSIAGRIELENLLRKSKSLSSELASLQKQIRGIDSDLETKRKVMVGGLEGEMSSLERSLGNAKPSDRGRIVGQLNNLRQAKIRYAEPLPEVPNAARLDSAMRDADSAADDPSEMIAVADELLDAEDQLRARVGAIEKQLQELRATRSLIRRADKFSKEERFFEESDRARVIAKYDVQSGSRKSNESAGTSAPQESTANANNANNADFDGNNANAVESDDAFAGSNEFGATADGQRSELTDSPSTAERAPQNTDPFSASRSVRIDGGGDPSRAIGSSESKTGGDLGRKIRSLESEQKRLKKQADALKKRAKKLRKKANSL